MDDPPDTTHLISDAPSLELVLKARAGDRLAAEALLERSMPQLRRWAHGRLPGFARGLIDTGDLVQDAVLQVLRKLDAFEPEHVGSMQAYLRVTVLNRIRDEIRRVTGRPVVGGLDEDVAGGGPSALEQAVAGQQYTRYRRALDQLEGRDRELVVARVEAEWSFAEIAGRFTLSSPDAARMAVNRAIERLVALARG